MTINFNGAAIKLTDTDLPELGSAIGVGEDEIHAFLDTESRGTGFDRNKRPTMLFEPHIFYRQLTGDQLTRAINGGLAYRNWGEKPYPADSYPRLMAAMQINETAALCSASWGYGQILGINHAEVKYATVQEMVVAFCESEKNQVRAIIDFLMTNHLDTALRAHDWAHLAAGYNGAGYAKNGYDKKLAANFAYWQAIKDTPWSPAPKTAPPAPGTAPMAPRPVKPVTPPTAPVSVASDGIWDILLKIFLIFIARKAKP